VIASKQGANLSNTGIQSNHPVQFAAKLPMRQRIAALSEALLVAPSDSRDELAMMLIELASFQSGHSWAKWHTGHWLTIRSKPDRTHRSPARPLARSTRR